MEVPAFIDDLGAGNDYNEAENHSSQYFSRPMLNFENYNDNSVLGQESNQAETNLLALTSKLSCLGQKAQQLEQFFRSQLVCSSGKDEHQEQAKSALNSILGEVILTSTSILSQCQSLINSQRPPQKEDNGKVEIIEINEEDILAEHTHFCKICGKGFRRDGNVRIHMRSHGNQYKTQEALMSGKPKASKSYYSCPFEDCRRNRRHPNFKPLKSMPCLRNHHRRSHCAKMYTCNKCGKEFSFVGDLKTHGNKCGHTTWRCSCNTTFASKDKLFRHVALFQEGHKPVLPSHTPSAAASLNREKPTRNEKNPVCCAQDADDLATEGPSTIAEGLPSYGNDAGLFMLDTGSVGIQHTEYMGQENEIAFFNEDREENELYGSLFWSHADLPWPEQL
ncbi:hypothetical protein SUGI_0578850 [Cryptomeria japonica]|nr:zinc finger protein WIP5 isoform X2 [Cryptomeria japonica]GLJ29349.1 hypothetical protein SUGI_0578850 [Cryptomeria japonica]